MQSIVTQRGQEVFQRLYAALQAMDRDCKNGR
jgi:hypothetical protein